MMRQQNENEDTSKRKFHPPVAWLLGRQLIASLKGTLLYTAFGSKLDARDWMRAREYPSADPKAAEESWQKQADSCNKQSAEEFWSERGEFWFDYLSDTGDGMRATYSLAYLCKSDLWANGALADLQGTPFGLYTGGVGVGFVTGENARMEPSDDYANADLNRAERFLDKTTQTLMPRGQFLLIGGDTAYHLSDYKILHTRLQTPFTWAHADAKADGRLLKDTTRPLFGIPGNHDYYDQLDGFRRQFRDPVKEEKDLSPGRELDGPQLAIPGFVRKQEASYVALRLPFGWQLWGLDTELGKLDDRQRKFFRDINQGAKPDKLIVATCAPTTVFGRYADSNDERAGKAFYQLGLPRPFLDPNDEVDDKKNTLERGQCRIDIAGDIHHYARYWGRPGGRKPRRSNAGQLESYHYASVVSGLGGAFHHPSTTDSGKICEQTLYPLPDESRRAVAAQIFKPWRIITGGGVWAIGFIVAFLLYFAVTIAQSSSQALATLPPLSWIDVTSAREIVPTASPGEQPLEVQRLWPWSELYGEAWSRPQAELSKPFIYFWGKEAFADAPPDYWLGVALSIISLVLMCLALVLDRHFQQRYTKRTEAVRRAIPPPVEEDEQAEQALPHASAKICEEMIRHYTFWVGLAIVLSGFAFGGTVLALEPYPMFITPFGISSIVLFTLLWATLATLIGVHYTDWLSRIAAEITITRRHWAIVWVLSVISVFGVVCGFGIFGRYNTAADMMTDILLMVVFLGVLVALTLVGAIKCGEVISGPARKWYVALGVMLGLFHAILQLFVPFLLVRKGSGWAWTASLALLVLMQVIGWSVLTRRGHKLLPVMWLIAGLLMLTIPYLAFCLSQPMLPSAESLSAFRSYTGAASGFITQALSTFLHSATAIRWEPLVTCFLAGVVGLLSSCVWLGWYLGSALVYHGHNNEAGGAARIEHYKQFIRFRVTDKDLTGFVIAVDEPKEKGRMLRPKLIDVIYLTLKR